MSIYSDTPSSNDFKPTYLYIKQHTITGLKYFGKTIGKNPVKYLGSGTYWNRHLAKHGKTVVTLWYKLYTDKNELIEYALNFSKENNIVESVEWANLKPEDGLRGGGAKGIKIKPHTDRHKKRISDGINQSNIRKGIIPVKDRPKIEKSEFKGGWKWSDEDKLKHSDWQIGIPKRRMCCIHCQTEGGIANILQWHGDNCKKTQFK
jgi:hypothetical protein